MPFKELTDYDTRSHAILDPLTGRAYEYSVDRGRFLKCFERRPSSLQTQMLHFAILHMQDAELADQIMVFLCRRLPHNLTNQLLQEFLLGVSFHHALHHLKIPHHLLDCFPNSSLPHLDLSGGTFQQSSFSISCKPLVPTSNAKRSADSLSLSLSSSPAQPSPSSAIMIPDRPSASGALPLPNQGGLSSSSPASHLATSPSFNPLLKFDHLAAQQGASRSAPPPAPRFQFQESEEAVVIRNSVEMSEEIIPLSPGFPAPGQPPDRIAASTIPSATISFTSATMKRFVAFFSPDKHAASPGSPPSSRASQPAGDVVDRYDYIEAIVNHWHAAFPKENQARLVELAKQFRIGQMNAVKRLFRHVRSALGLVMELDFAKSKELFLPPSQQLYSYFYVLETLYAVLEELHLPFPHQFQQIRFYLGFRCLPLELFIQYLNRDILFPSTTDIRLLISCLANGPPEGHHHAPFDVNGRLERTLLNRLSFKQQVSILTSLPATQEVDRYIYEIFTFCCPLRPHFIDYENTEDSAFVPLSVWKEALRTMCPTTPISSQRSVLYHTFLTESADQVYSDIFVIEDSINQ